MRRFVLLLIIASVIASTACGGQESQAGNRHEPVLPEESTGEEPDQAPMDVQVVYYFFLEDPEGELPSGSATILPEILVLSPVLTDPIPVADTASGILAGIEAMIGDPRNEWTGDGLQVSNVTFADGHADVILDGGVTAAGGIVLVAFRAQLLLTVFADSCVNTATVTLDGECIGNLGISHESEELEPGHVYTRADIEAIREGY